MYKMWNKIRPMIYSALFLLGNTFLIQYVGSLYNPSFNLLASRGFEKIIFTTLVIGHALALALTKSKEFFKKSLTINVYFLWQSKWIRSFLSMFFIFFSLHALMLFCIGSAGYLHYNPAYHVTLSIIRSIGLGFIVTFFLAWTEELIFRGILFRYINQILPPLTSVFIASLIFMFAHDLARPWNLITVHWHLGLGLFLLGMLLNLLFLISGKLYISMGAHAGLVFVKVILRRIPLIKYLPTEQLPWWLAIDLRQSHLTHILFGLTILLLLGYYTANLLRKHSH